MGHEKITAGMREKARQRHAGSSGKPGTPATAEDIKKQKEERKKREEEKARIKAKRRQEAKKRSLAKGGLVKKK